MKVGNSPKTTVSYDEASSKADSGSWRHAIFKRVATPKPEKEQMPDRKRTKEELNILWKKSIYQAILLVRMEKENAKIRGKMFFNSTKCYVAASRGKNIFIVTLSHF